LADGQGGGHGAKRIPNPLLPGQNSRHLVTRCTRSMIGKTVAYQARRYFEGANVYGGIPLSCYFRLIFSG
jgi:hypothetical protein